MERTGTCSSDSRAGVDCGYLVGIMRSQSRWRGGVQPSEAKLRGSRAVVSG